MLKFQADTQILLSIVLEGTFYGVFLIQNLERKDPDYHSPIRGAIN